METFGNDLVAICGKKVAKSYYCKNCDYKCCKKYNWDKHILTSKHLKEMSGNDLEIKSGKKWQNNQDEYSCQCGKKFKTNSGLWKHHKICSFLNKENNNSSLIDKDDLILMVIKQNAELLEIVKNGTTINSNNTTNTNSHNKAFNLNLFLNETCKNAMNITDFVDSIKLQLSDFMDVGKVGFVKGISDIIVNKLNSLDETVRPIHCTDQKRETFYVKDENKWEKEEEDLKNIRKMIKKVVRKNEGLMLEYKKEFPDYDDPESKRSDQYSKFVIEALGGDGDNNNEKENKIINHISKATTIKNKTNKET
jgi:hypothetical protein